MVSLLIAVFTQLYHYDKKQLKTNCLMQCLNLKGPSFLVLSQFPHTVEPYSIQEGISDTLQCHLKNVK